MSISESLRQQLYTRAGGQCECTMEVCTHHYGKCQNRLVNWEAHHRVAGGEDTLSNLIAMCQTCHKNTRTYGAH